MIPPRWCCHTTAFFAAASAATGSGLASAFESNVGPDGSCPIVTLLPFTSRGQPNKERPVQVAFTHMASALMAMEHFNSRNPVVIEELIDEEFAWPEDENDSSGCSVFFPLPDLGGNASLALGYGRGGSGKMSVIADDGDGDDTTIRALIDAVSSPLECSSTSGDAEKERRPLCAVLGSYLSWPARSAGTGSSASNAPFITHAAETTKLGRPSLYPHTAKNTADEYARGDAVMSYIQSIGRDYVALIYNFPVEDVFKVLDVAARERNMTLLNIPVAPPWREGNKHTNSAWDAMRRLKESGFRTVVVALNRQFVWQHIEREAQSWSTNTDEYLWLSYDTSDLDTLISDSHEPGSDKDKLLRGMGAVRVLDGPEWRDGVGDKFSKAWQSNDVSFVHRLNAMNPVGEGEPGYFHAQDDYFVDEQYKPKMFSTFMYDTVMAVGMGACRAQRLLVDRERAERGGGEGDPNGRALVSADGADTFVSAKPLLFVGRPGKNLLFNETVKVEFQGASGFVKLNDGFSFQRDPSTFAFGVYNIRPREATNETTGEWSYEYFLTSVRRPGADTWISPRSGEKFVYSDGTTTKPTPVREVFEHNFLSLGVRAGGLSLFVIAVFINVVFALWTFINRSKRAVRAAQPEFLCLLCFGSIVSSMAILTLSFDESYGWTQKQLSRACMATPWFFFLGYIIVYASIFSKLMRINQVLQFRRQRVKARHVIGPALLLILMAVVVLAVWTAIDPWTWVRSTVDFTTGETYGQCTSDNFAAFFATLCALIIVATMLAAFMAWKTKDVDSQFAEGSWIFYAIFTQIQVWFVGVPVLIIVSNMSVDATYLGRVLIIWTFAVSIVLLVVGPRMLSSILGKKNETNRGVVGNGVRITGVSAPVGSDFNFTNEFGKSGFGKPEDDGKFGSLNGSDHTEHRGSTG